MSSLQQQESRAGRRIRLRGSSAINSALYPGVSSFGPSLPTPAGGGDGLQFPATLLLQSSQNQLVRRMTEQTSWSQLAPSRAHAMCSTVKVWNTSVGVKSSYLGTTRQFWACRVNSPRLEGWKGHSTTSPVYHGLPVILSGFTSAAKPMPLTKEEIPCTYTYTH